MLMPGLSLPVRGYMLATLSSLAAALFFVPYKKGLETMTANQFLLAVYIIGFVLNLVGSGLKGKRSKVSTATWIGAIGFTILSVLGNYSIGRSLEGLEPSLTAVMVRCQIVVVIFLGWWWLKEKLNPFLVPGVTIALGGLFWMNFSGKEQFSDNIVFFLWGFKILY